MSAISTPSHTDGYPDTPDARPRNRDKKRLGEEGSIMHSRSVREGQLMDGHM